MKPFSNIEHFFSYDLANAEKGMLGTEIEALLIKRTDLNFS
jgi:hypothetical protein